MALTVEDGTCIATANALVTRAEYIAWMADFYPAVTVGNDTTTDGAIMRASSWVSTYPDWDGTMKCGRGLQGLAFPRTGVTDCNGDAVPDDEVPSEVKQATYLATSAELTLAGVLTPTITPGQQVKRIKVDVIEQEFMTPVDQKAASAPNPVETLRPMLTAVNDLLKCLGSMPDGMNVPWPWVA